MMNAPTGLTWGLAEVTNCDQVRALDWQLLDMHACYLAAVRRLSVPMLIAGNDPLGSDWCQDGLGGTVRLSLLLPAFATHFTLQSLQQWDQCALGMNVGASPYSLGYRLSEDSGFSWSVWGEMRPHSQGTTIAEAAWESTDPFLLATVPVANGAFPPPLVRRTRYTDSGILELDAVGALGDDLRVWALSVQPQTTEGAKLA